MTLPIKSIADLKGKIMPWGYNAQTTGRILQRGRVGVQGLTMNDVKTVPTRSLFAGVDLLGEGKVEARHHFCWHRSGTQANVRLASRGGVRFINMDASPEAVRGYEKSCRLGRSSWSPPPMRSEFVARQRSWPIASSSPPTTKCRTM